MIALFRADWLRLRQRRDLWLVIAAVAILAILSYSSGLANASASAEISPDISPEARNVQETFIEPYAYPQSVITVLAGGQVWVLMMLAYLTAATIGAEFSYGTIRTTLTVRSDRRAFLAVRWAALALVATVMLAVLIVVGAAAPGVIAAVLGASLPESPPIMLLGLIGLLGALALFGSIVIGVTVIGALIVRNAAMALLITIGYSLLESAVAGFAERGGPAMAAAVRLLPISDAALLIQRAQRAAGIVRLPGAPETTAAGPPTALAVAVGIGWLIALIWVSLELFQRADITE